VFHEGGASAKGGYYNAGKRYHTSARHVFLRVRNTVVCMIACVPWNWLPVALPARLSGVPLRGIAWNVIKLTVSLARRRSLERCKAARRAVHRVRSCSQFYGARVIQKLSEEILPHEY
jgi:hypothetical protein